MAHSHHKYRITIGNTILAASLVFGILASPVTVHAQTGTAVQQQSISKLGQPSEEYASYLANRYQIQWNGVVTVGQFIDALAKVLHLEKGALANDQNGRADTPLLAQAAVTLAVKQAGLSELADTYSQEKAAKVLAQTKLAGHGKLSADLTQDIAVAIDTGILPVAYEGIVAENGQVLAEFAELLVGKVLEFKGEYKNYLGYTTDDDIYGKLVHAWESSTLLDVPELRKVVDEALKQNLVTGYNLKDARYTANFDPKRSLTYGHSDITHAVQLIGLLRSEGIQAKVQFEPKTSAFIYLKDWGEPKETPDYKVVQIENGNYIAYAKEYDISLEFGNEADKAAFDGLIAKYAKKNEENAKGLLYDSWWQPLYSSQTELKGYQLITNNFITKGNYIAQSFSLRDKSAEVVAGFKKLDPTGTITSYRFWVDQPFYNYLLGEYK